jgi:hypothetical protein
VNAGAHVRDAVAELSQAAAAARSTGRVVSAGGGVRQGGVQQHALAVFGGTRVIESTDSGIASRLIAFVAQATQRKKLGMPGRLRDASRQLVVAKDTACLT